MTLNDKLEEKKATMVNVKVLSTGETVITMRNPLE
jgi:hypothetical protein